MKKTMRMLAAAAGLLTLTGSAMAQPAQTAKPGLLHRMFHRNQPVNSRPAYGRPAYGRIIGNRRSHVYHLPGDRGAMPDAANRVYFRSEAAARAAGYHRAGRRTTNGNHRTGSYTTHRAPRRTQ